jgi:preprotein translocase subunit Sec63
MERESGKYVFVIFIGLIIALLSIQVQQIRHKKNIDKIFDDYEVTINSNIAQ